MCKTLEDAERVAASCFMSHWVDVWKGKLRTRLVGYDSYEWMLIQILHKVFVAGRNVNAKSRDVDPSSSSKRRHIRVRMICGGAGAFFVVRVGDSTLIDCVFNLYNQRLHVCARCRVLRKYIERNELAVVQSGIDFPRRGCCTLAHARARSRTPKRAEGSWPACGSATTST